MKLQIKRTSVFDESASSYRLIKTENKVANFFLGAILSTVVFFIVQIIFSMISGMAADGLYFAFNFQELTSIIQNPESYDMAEFVSKIMNWKYMTPISLALELIMIIAVILVAKIYQKRKASSLGFTRTKNTVPHYLIGCVLGFVLFSASVLICLATKSISISVNPEKLDVGLFIFYFVGWLFQGMAEEAICRGFIMTTMARKNSLATAIIFNSVFFAALHLGNDGISVLPLINLTLFGVFASLLFIRTNNIWMAGAMHSIWNMVQGNFYGILVSGGFTGPSILKTTLIGNSSLINGGDFGLEGGLAVTIVYTIGILILLFVPSLKKKEETKELAA